MRVFAYAFKAGKWVETPRLSVRDVALLVDTEGRTIYIWHGPKSKIKDQNEAKKLLLSLRDRYSSFQFQKVGRNPAPELQQEIKRLLGSPLGQGKTRIFAITSMVAGVAGIVIGVFVLYILFSQDYNSIITPMEGGGWPTGFEVYNGWLQTMTWGTGIGMIAFGAAALFAALSGRTYILITLIIGLGMGIVSIAWINWLRPTISQGFLWSEDTFSLFQTLVAVMTIVSFAPFTIGLIAELIRIAQE